MLDSEIAISKFLIDRFSEDGQILFAGAGIGRRVNLPDWSEYAEKIAFFAEKHEPEIAAVMRSRIRAQRYPEAFALFEQCDNLPPADRFKALAQPFQDPEPDPDPLLSLLRLPFDAVITTNFDRSLVEAYAKARGKAARTAGPSDTPLKECPYIAEFYIARIHGKVEHPPSMVLTSDAYTALEYDDSYIDFLNFAFTHRRCLFLGFSFVDPAISNVLTTIAKKSIVAAKTHYALLPSSAPPELAQKLASVGVRVESYKDDNHHEILWDGIARAASSAIESPVDPSNVSAAYNRTKHLVAISYAVAQLSVDDGTALSDLVLQGVVLSSIEKCESTLPEIAKALRAVVPMESAEAEALTARLLEVLESRGVAIQIGGTEPLWKASSAQAPPTDPIDVLLASFENRLLVRESIELKPEHRKGVAATIRSVLVERAWELAQEFMTPAASAEKEDRAYLDHLASAVKINLPTVPGDRREAVVRTLINLLTEPNPDQEAVLADLIRLAFGVQVVTTTGRSALYKLVLPEKLYLDSNILMPLVIEGHPNSHGLQGSLRKLRQSSKSLSILIPDVFLNEVISHRGLAIQEFRDLGLEKPAESEQYSDYFGPTGTNAFIAGYLNRSEKLLDITFGEWLEKVAPYRTEAELEKWLRHREFVVINTSPRSAAEHKALGEMELSLDKGYDQLESRSAPGIRRKPEILKDHEARVLTKLKDDIESSHRSYLVTDDKKLRAAVQMGQNWEIEENVISHLSLIQLIDLTVGNRVDANVLNSIVWSMRIVDDKMFLRHYLISRIEKHYDAAMLISMPKMLDSFVDKAAKEAKQEGVEIRPTRDTNAGRTTRFVRRIEREFYEEMAKEVKKIKEQLR
jgi:hypothetical protein